MSVSFRQPPRSSGKRAGTNRIAPAFKSKRYDGAAPIPAQRIAVDGLKFRASARIDLREIAGQPRDMAQAAILSYVKNPVGAAQDLLARATQARRIALTLSKHDSDIAEAYAAECEAEARRLLGWRSPIAA